jgi:hypothetical protein
MQRAEPGFRGVYHRAAEGRTRWLNPGYFVSLAMTIACYPPP